MVTFVVSKGKGKPQEGKRHDDGDTVESHMPCFALIDDIDVVAVGTGADAFVFLYESSLVVRGEQISLCSRWVTSHCFVPEEHPHDDRSNVQQTNKVQAEVNETGQMGGWREFLNPGQDDVGIEGEEHQTSE